VRSEAAGGPDEMQHRITRDGDELALARTVWR
jgi:hypothetical protein